MDTKLKHFTISTLLAFLCKRQGLTSPIVADKPASQNLKVLFAKRCFCRYQPVEQAGSEQWKSLQSQGVPRAPRGSCPRKETRGGITSLPPPNLPFPTTLALLPTPLIARDLKTTPGRKAALPAGAAGQAGRGAGLLAETSPGTCAALEAGQGALGTEISYSKQNIVLYETIKKVPEGGPKYILYFTLNPCFDLTL